MSVVMLENTKDDIQKAYKAKSLPKIGKETLYVFNRVVTYMLSSFKDRLKGITFETFDFDFDEKYLLSQKNMDYMLKLLESIMQVRVSKLSDFDFGKMKVDLERWYYHMGGEGMYYEYQENYLITPKEAAELLGVSTVTLNKYMKQGLETVDTTSHNKIPKHAIALWKDPVYAIRMQILTQEKKNLNQTLDERLQEVREEIFELQKEYKVKTIQEALKKYKMGNLDAMDDPADFRKWKDLVKEHDQLLNELIGGTESD